MHKNNLTLALLKSINLLKQFKIFRLNSIPVKYYYYIFHMMSKNQHNLSQEYYSPQSAMSSKSKPVYTDCNFQLLQQYQTSKKQFITSSKSGQFNIFTNMKQTKKNYLMQYKKYFDDVEDSADQKIHLYLNDYDRCLKNKIMVLGSDQYNMTPFNRFVIQILGVQNLGLTVTYQIKASVFKIQIYLLNIINQSIKLSQIGSGQFGSIYRINYDDKKCIVSKRIKFNEKKFYINTTQLNLKARKQLIEDAMAEYSIYKICSFFEIGPQVESIGGFDMVCFQDAIEFYMEYCDQLRNTQFLQNQMKIALRILHKFNIIHKDIKPLNILYSRNTRKNIFTDFGISHTIIQNLGYLTQTYKEGTLFYMSEQLKGMNNFQKKLIDLYYNDYHCFKVSLEQIRNRYKLENNNILQYKRLPQIRMMYRCIYILSILLEEEPQQIQKMVNELTEKQNFKLLKLMLKNLKKNRLAELIAVLQNLNSKLLIDLLQGCREIYLTKQQKIQVNQQNFLIRIYGLDLNLLQQFIKYHQKIPSYICRYIQTIYHNQKHTQREYLIFIAQNEALQNYLLKKIHLHQTNSINKRKQKLYILKNLIEILFVSNIQKSKYIDLIKKIKILDKKQEYNSIISFYQFSNNMSYPITVEIYTQLTSLQYSKQNQIQSEIRNYIALLKKTEKAHPQLLKKILNKVQPIKSNRLFCKKSFKIHDICINNTNVLYELVESINMYLRFKQYIYDNLLESIQNDIIQNKRYFYQLKNVFIEMERCFNIQDINHCILLRFYYNVKQYYISFGDLSTAITYIDKYLNIIKKDSTYTTFEICQYYCEIAINYIYLENFSRAIEYYKKIPEHLYWSYGQYDQFFAYINDKITQCNYWLSAYQNLIPEQKKPISNDKKIQYIEIFYHSILKEYKQISVKLINRNRIKFFIRQIIYLIDRICMSTKDIASDTIHIFISCLKQSYYNEQYHLLLHIFRSFIDSYIKNEIKISLILMVGIYYFLKSSFKKSLFYYKNYIQSQQNNPSPDNLESSYNMIIHFFNIKNYKVSIYLIHKCFKMWQNYQIFCLYMKLAQCYKQQRKTPKYYKYLLKAIKNKHIVKDNLNDNQKIQIILTIIKDFFKYKLQEEILIMISILKCKFKYENKKLKALKLKIEKQQQNQKQYHEDWCKKLRELKIKKQQKMRVKMVVIHFNLNQKIKQKRSI